jgi:hypothetical protein
MMVPTAQDMMAHGLPKAFESTADGEGALVQTRRVTQCQGYPC